MELNNLRPAQGSVKKEKRIGRGTGSGHGGTSTRGHKGDKARSGSKEKRHFEGGQTPMQRRLPKRGFKNVNREVFVPINLSAIEAYVQKSGVSNLDVAAMVSAGLAKASDRIKILGYGTLSSKVNIKAHAVSASAKTAVEAAGGSVELV
jgi:large subunit ribosomal protein L15